MSVAARRSSGPPLSFGVPNDTREKMPEPRKSVGLQRDPNSGLVSNPFDAPNEDKTRKVSLTFDKVNKSLLPLSADQRSILEVTPSNHCSNKLNKTNKKKFQSKRVVYHHQATVLM